MTSGNSTAVVKHRTQERCNCHLRCTGPTAQPLQVEQQEILCFVRQIWGVRSRLVSAAVQVKTFRVKKQMLFGEFRELVAEELGVPLEQQRFWTFAKRQNSTLRCRAAPLPALNPV